MKGKIVAIILCLLCFVIGYIIGDCFPLNLREIEICDAPMSKGEYYGNLIGAFGAISTFMAVVVALFASEIQSCFRKVKFDVKLSDGGVVEDLVDDGNGGKKASRYYSSIQIANYGNVNALNCELYLEKAEAYANKYDESNGKIIDTDYVPINIGNIGGNVYIPSNGKKVLQIIEILSPEKQSTPDGGMTVTKPQVNIPGLKNIDKQFESGKLKLTYCLYSSNAKPKKFDVIIFWNGTWETRQKEMRQVLTTELK